MRSLLWLISAGLLVTVTQATTSHSSCEHPEKLEDYLQCRQVAMKVAEFIEDLLRGSAPNPNQPDPSQDLTEKEVKKDAGTFPFCAGLTVPQCSDLLSMLEQLTQDVQSSGLYAKMLDSMSKEVPDRVKRQAATPRVHTLEFLALYREWKEAKQMAKRTTRWGRSVEQMLARMASDFAKQSPKPIDAGRNEESTVPQTFLQYILEKYRDNENGLGSLRREKRGTHRMSPSDLKSLKDMLDYYRGWHVRHGYGKRFSRWGR